MAYRSGSLLPDFSREDIRKAGLVGLVVGILASAFLPATYNPVVYVLKWTNKLS